MLNRLRSTRSFVLFAVFLAMPLSIRGDDQIGKLKKTIERITLDQPGTRPFHLIATLAAARNADANLTGRVEMWWVSPTKWKREIRSPEFHQIAIQDGSKEWQKNDGDYFPEWLREVSVALVIPVPNPDEVIAELKAAEVRSFRGTTHYSWTIASSDGTVQKTMGAGMSISDETGLLLYGSGLGWDAELKNYQDFHNRKVARTVSAGQPQVTATVTMLDDLQKLPADFFDTNGVGGDPMLHTVIVDELSLRKNLLPSEPIVWPPLKDGPLQGILTTEVVIDRAGRVRDVGVIVTDNPGTSETAKAAIAAMQFKPYLENSVPVQVVSRITMPFKTVRPTGVETFESARTYFEKGRAAGFPAAHQGPAYSLQAAFRVKVHSGTVETGQYVDLWESGDTWRREATIAQSRYVRSQHGEKRYRLAEGPDAALLGLVLKFMEPIPAIDTFVESDWRIKRDTVDGASTIRVLTGYESPDGKFDPEHTRGYWFDESGVLVKAYVGGLEIRRSEFRDFGGAKVATRIEAFNEGQLAMRIDVVNISAASPQPDQTFEVRGHEWTRAFTDEAR